MNKFCKHGKHIKFCGECANLWFAEQSPHVEMNSMDPGRDAMVGVAKDQLGIVSVTVQERHPSLDLLDDTVRIVHVRGHLFVWGLEEILKRAKKVREIEVQPGEVKKLTETHRAICAKAGVRLVEGYSNPELAWKPGEVRRSTKFKKTRKFFQLLEGDQKRLFDELISYGMESALIARDYYDEESDGKEGQEPVTLHTLCKKYGYNENMLTYVSERISCVSVYLDPKFKASENARRLARVMKDDVERLRERFATAKARQDQATALGLRILPVDMPLQLFDELEHVVLAHKRGWLKKLQNVKPRSHKALMLRYDVRDSQNPCFRTLEQVAEVMDDGFKTRERSRQLIDEAFDFLFSLSKHSGEPLKQEALQEKSTRIAKNKQKKAARVKAGPVTQLTKVPGPVEKQVINLVCQSYGVDEMSLFSDSREHPYAEARQVVMVLWRRYLNWSYPLIGKEMGKDHSTVMSGCQEINSRRKTDRALEQRMTLIEMMLGKPPPDLNTIEMSPDPSTASQ